MFFKNFFQNLVNFFQRPEPEPEPPEPTQSIATIASENGNFDILVAALDVAGLTGTFAGEGDFTVFAPTDAAFTELASKTLGLDVEGKSETEIALMLVDALTVPTLTSVLEYHVKAGSSDIESLQNEGSVTTLLTEPGFATSFTVNGNELGDADPEVEDPEFVEGLTDLRATNGIIQVIDRVLLPIDVAEAMAQPTIEDIASSNDSFEVLSAALAATGLDTVVDDRDADFTVFAPTDDAFRALAADLSIDVTDIEDKDIAGELVTALGADLVADVLLYHVKSGSSSLEELQDARLVDTAFSGAQVGIDGTELVDADPQIENPNLILPLTDIEAANGAIQAIDRVLLPIDVGPVEDLKIKGTKKDDFLQGGAGDDKLFGRKGDDIMVAGEGDDHLFGNLGADKLIGGGGDDKLRGGLGNDHLDGGAGDDDLIGGIGADKFDFTEFDGHDTVRDFRWNDTLILSSDDFETAQAAVDAAEQTKRGVLLETDDGSLFLRGVRHLEEEDILLV